MATNPTSLPHRWLRVIALSACIASFSHVLMGQSLVSTIKTGSETYPSYLVTDSTNRLLYVVANGNNTVEAISLKTNAVIATVAVGSNPSAITINPTNGLVYVCNKNSSSVTVINPANGYSTTTVSVAPYPYDVAVNPVDGKIYVADYSPTAVISVIDPSHNNAVSKIVAAVPYQWKIAINSSTGMVYTSGANCTGCNNTSSITAINPFTDATSFIPVGKLPYSMVIDPSSNNVYVSNQTSPYISVIYPSNSNSVTTIPLSGATGTTSLVLDATSRIFCKSTRRRQQPFYV